MPSSSYRAASGRFSAAGAGVDDATAVRGGASCSRGGARRLAGRCALALMLAGLAAVGCRGAASQPPASKPPEVLVSLPVAREVTDFEDFTGRTEAVAMIEIRARVSGYLNRVQFEEGAEVKQGDALFEIDPRPYEAEQSRAQASVAQSQARLDRLELEYQRARGLLARRAISQEEFDKVSGDRAEAAAAVGVAEGSRDMVELNLAFTHVNAPISGRVGRTLIDPGNLVKADETVLTTIVSLDPIYVYFDIDERTMLRIRRLVRDGNITSSPAQAVPLAIGLADEEGYPHPGAIDFVDNRLDPGTGTLRVRGRFENPDRLLSPGLFVRVRLPIGSPYPALLVAEQALGTDQGQKFVYVVNGDDEVVYRPVRTERVYDGLRVIAHGVAGGDRVIVSGLQRARPGVRVQAELVDMPAGAASAAPASRGNNESAAEPRSGKTHGS